MLVGLWKPESARRNGVRDSTAEAMPRSTIRVSKSIDAPFHQGAIAGSQTGLSKVEAHSGAASAIASKASRTKSFR
jgi:hypothetical protein